MFDEELVEKDFKSIDFSICKSFDEIDALFDSLREKYQIIRCLDNRWYCLVDKGIDRIIFSTLIKDDFFYIDPVHIFFIFEFDDSFKVRIEKINYCNKLFGNNELNHRRFGEISSITIIENLVYIYKKHGNQLFFETIDTFVKNVVIYRAVR